MRIFNCEILSYKPIIFGELIANQFVIFEHKKLFGIIIFYFKGNEQDRFHTHAFNSLSIKLFGTYLEGILDSKTKEITHKRRTNVFKYFPRDTYHSINYSTGCCTILLQGPWKKHWKEYKNGAEYTLGWHRNSITKL